MNHPVFRNRWSATLDGEVILYRPAAAARSDLAETWSPTVPAQFSPPPICETPATPGQPAPPASPAVTRSCRTEKPNPSRTWLIGFAAAFHKAVDSIDRNLQGRILQAISNIATEPLRSRGDTVKPLSGDMDGFWRYRIGDFRLVYYPDETTHTITLYDFASRGSVYD